MASDEDIQDVLNKVELIKKRMKIVQVEEKERKRRNLQSDEILSRFADPQMRQKWRIYKMVEEQCSRIEDEVRIEVERKMRLKRMQLNEAANPSGLIKQVGRLQKEVQVSTTAPNTSKPMVALKKPKKLPMPELPQMNHKPDVPNERFKPSRVSQSTKDVASHIKAPQKAKDKTASETKVTKEPIMTPKATLKGKKQFLSPSLPSNVKLVHVTHHPPQRRPITLLSGHIYPGVDIPPCEIKLKASPPILILKEDSVEIPSISKSSTSSRNIEQTSRLTPKLVTTSIKDVPEQIEENQELKESSDTSEDHKEVNFEKEVENQENLDKEHEEEEGKGKEHEEEEGKGKEHEEEEGEDKEEEDEEDTLGTDRLSTIPEDTESKLVSPQSQNLPGEEDALNAPKIAPKDTVQSQESSILDDDTEESPSPMSGFQSSDITLKEGVLSDSDASDGSPRSKPNFEPGSLTLSPEKFPVHFDSDPESCVVHGVVAPLKEMAKFVVMTQSSLNMSIQPPSEMLHSNAIKSFQTEATQTSLPEATLDSGSLSETTVESNGPDPPSKESSSMPSSEPELSEGQLLLSISNLLSEGEVSRADPSNPVSSVPNLLECSKSNSEGEISNPHATSS